MRNRKSSRKRIYQQIRSFITRNYITICNLNRSTSTDNWVGIVRVYGICNRHDVEIVPLKMLFFKTASFTCKRWALTIDLSMSLHTENVSVFVWLCRRTYLWYFIVFCGNKIEKRPAGSTMVFLEKFVPVNDTMAYIRLSTFRTRNFNENFENVFFDATYETSAIHFWWPQSPDVTGQTFTILSIVQSGAKWWMTAVGVSTVDFHDWKVINLYEFTAFNIILYSKMSIKTEKNWKTHIVHIVSIMANYIQLSALVYFIFQQIFVVHSLLVIFFSRKHKNRYFVQFRQ